MNPPARCTRGAYYNLLKNVEGLDYFWEGRTPEEGVVSLITHLYNIKKGQGTNLTSEFTSYLKCEILPPIKTATGKSTSWVMFTGRNILKITV